MQAESMPLLRLTLLLLALSPLAAAQSPPNLDAVCARLANAVEAGELTMEQADTMIASLAQRRLREHFEFRKRKANAAGGSGGAAKALRDMGVDDETLGRVKKGFAEAGLKGERLEGAFGALARLVHTLRSGDEPSEELQRYVKERLRLDENQLRYLHGYAHRIHKAIAGQKKASQENDLGISDKSAAWAKELLAKRGGFEGERLDNALRAVARITAGLRKGAKVSGEGLQKRHDLTDEQVALLISIATRISQAEGQTQAGRADHEKGDAQATWMKEVLQEQGGLEGEELRNALLIAAKLSTAMGEESEIQEKLKEKLHGHQHRDLLIRVASRMSRQKTHESESRSHQEELQTALKELKEAIAAGKVDKEAAKKKAEAITKRLQALRDEEAAQKEALEPLDIRYRRER